MSEFELVYEEQGDQIILLFANFWATVYFWAVLFENYIHMRPRITSYIFEPKITICRYMNF
jgi:hypothetical protein